MDSDYFLIFQNFKLSLQSLKKLLSWYKGDIIDVMCARLLKCFADDPNLWTSGYDKIHSVFEDNKILNTEWLSQLAHYERDNWDKIMNRDFGNYLRTKHQSNVHHPMIDDWLLDVFLHAIAQEKVFEPDQIMKLHIYLKHILEDAAYVKPTEKEISEYIGTICSLCNISWNSKLHTLIIRRLITTFLKNPTQKNLHRCINESIDPSLKEQIIQVGINRSGLLTMLLIVGAVGYFGGKYSKYLYNPFLSNTYKKVTMYNSPEELSQDSLYFAQKNISDSTNYDIEYGKDEPERIADTSFIRANRKRNTNIFFDRLDVNEKGMMYYKWNKDNQIYYFHESDREKAMSVIDNINYRRLDGFMQVMRKELLYNNAIVDPLEDKLLPIVTNFSFFPLGDYVLWQFIPEKDKKIKNVLLNTFYISVHPDSVESIESTMGHEILHGALWWLRLNKIATEGKTERLTVLYSYLLDGSDMFDIMDSYALWELCDDFMVQLLKGTPWTWPYTECYKDEPGYLHYGYRDMDSLAIPDVLEYYNHWHALSKSYKESGIDDLGAEYANRAEWYARAARVLKVHEFFMEHKYSQIHPVVVLLAFSHIKDTDNTMTLDELYTTALSLSMVASEHPNQDLARKLWASPHMARYIVEIINYYKNSDYYKSIQKIDNPEDWITYFDKVKHDFVLWTPIQMINAPDDMSIWERIMKLIFGDDKKGDDMTDALSVDAQGEESNNEDLKWLTRLFISAAVGIILLVMLLKKQSNLVTARDKILKLLAAWWSIEVKQRIDHITHNTETTLYPLLLVFGWISFVMLFVIGAVFINQKIFLGSIVEYIALVLIMFGGKKLIDQKRKHISQLKEALVPYQSLMCKTHYIQDLVSYNCACIREYKKQLHFSLDEGEALSWLNMRYRRVLDVIETSTACSHVQIGEICSARLDKDKMDVLMKALGVSKIVKKQYEFTEWDPKLLNIWDEIVWKIDRKWSAKYDKKLVAIPMLYKQVKQEAKVKIGTVLVALCLDGIPFDWDLIEINKKHSKLRNTFQSKWTDIATIAWNNQLQQLKNMFAYINALGELDMYCDKRIKIACTFAGKIVWRHAIEWFNNKSLRDEAAKFYRMSFRDFLIRDEQIFADNQFIADHFNEQVPEKVITVSYLPWDKSFSSILKQYAIWVWRNLEVIDIDSSWALIQDT